jgi:hypothetical protein
MGHGAVRVNTRSAPFLKYATGSSATYNCFPSNVKLHKFFVSGVKSYFLDYLFVIFFYSLYSNGANICMDLFSLHVLSIASALAFHVLKKNFKPLTLNL